MSMKLPLLLSVLLAAPLFAADNDAPKKKETAPATNAPPKPAHSNGPDAAKAETARMTPADGLQVQLFASEPMVVNPCDMDIDARGRVWIAEGANYRLSMHANWGNIRAEGDRIVILEDTNGDGVADKATTFYQDPSINAALGICVLGNKVIVSSSPNVFVLTDTDGDGKADKREVLFTGIGGFDHDHGVHAFVFGPDGKLYFNFGNAGNQLCYPTEELKKNCPLHGLLPKEEIAAAKPLTDVDGNLVTDKGKPYRQGMVFRCNLDGSEVETLGHNFRNNYEVAVDSFGTLWQSDNDDDGNRGVRINYVMEYGNFGYADEMTGAGWGVGWKKRKPKARRRTKSFLRMASIRSRRRAEPVAHRRRFAHGHRVYEGKLLPEVFRNQVIHCDAGPRVVRAYPVKPDGAGYSATITDMSHQQRHLVSALGCLRRAGWLAVYRGLARRRRGRPQHGGSEIGDDDGTRLSHRAGRQQTIRAQTGFENGGGLRRGRCNRRTRRRVISPGRSCTRCRARRKKNCSNFGKAMSRGCARARCNCWPASKAARRNMSKQR